MSKSKVPSLPAGANRAAMQKFVLEARRYARTEYSKGASEAEVYQRLNKAGIPLPALREQLSTEYLLFVGVTDSQIRGLRFLAGLTAMIFYGFIAGKLTTGYPLYRYGVTAILAIAVFKAIELSTIRFWKMRRGKKRD